MSLTVISGNQTHLTIGIDIASSGASNADRFALVVERTDASGSRIEHAAAKAGMRPTDAVEQCVNILRLVDAAVENPRRTWITVAIDRTGDAGTAEMLETAIRAEKWKCLVKVRRVWITAGDGVNPPKKGDKTDPHRTKWSVGRDELQHGLVKRLRLGEVDATDVQGATGPLLREQLLEGLVLKQSGTGKSRIDHKPGKHDDVAMAAGLADWAARGRRLGGHTPGGHPALAQPTAAPAREPAAARTAVQPAPAPAPAPPRSPATAYGRAVAGAAPATGPPRRGGIIQPSWGRSDVR